MRNRKKILVNEERQRETVDGDRHRERGRRRIAEGGWVRMSFYATIFFFPLHPFIIRPLLDHLFILYTHVHGHSHARTRVHTHTYALYAHTHTHTRTQTYTRIRTRTHIYTYTHTHTHSYTHIYYFSFSHLPYPKKPNKLQKRPFFVTGAAATACLAGSVALSGGAITPVTIACGTILAGYWTAGLADLRQPHHAVLRNFPVLGRIRYVMETIRPEIHQYFVSLCVY